jgi:hypothetical protein
MKRREPPKAVYLRPDARANGAEGAPLLLFLSVIGVCFGTMSADTLIVPVVATNDDVRSSLVRILRHEL